MTIHVTETQRFITRLALAAAGSDERLDDPKLIDDVIRAMLVIERGRMQAYMLNGFNWSCLSRNRREPLEVARDRENLDDSVQWFHQHIDNVRCEATRRIRANRARHEKLMLQDAQELHDREDWQMHDLQLVVRGDRQANAANEDEEPRLLPVGRPDEDAA